jgi:hypothetical protein
MKQMNTELNWKDWIQSICAAHQQWGLILEVNGNQRAYLGDTKEDLLHLANNTDAALFSSQLYNPRGGLVFDYTPTKKESTSDMAFISPDKPFIPEEKARIFGDARPLDLDKIFVELVKKYPKEAETIISLVRKG